MARIKAISLTLQSKPFGRRVLGFSQPELVGRVVGRQPAGARRCWRCGWVVGTASHLDGLAWPWGEMERCGQEQLHYDVDEAFLEQFWLLDGLDGCC